MFRGRRLTVDEPALLGSDRDEAIATVDEAGAGDLAQRRVIRDPRGAQSIRVAAAPAAAARTTAAARRRTESRHRPFKGVVGANFAGTDNAEVVTVAPAPGD